VGKGVWSYDLLRIGRIMAIIHISTRIVPVTLQIDTDDETLVGGDGVIEFVL